MHAARVFWDRTLGWQLGRESPFSIWDWRQYHARAARPPLLQRVLEGLLIAARSPAYFVPRRKSPLQLAALTAALLIGFELVLTHWFYLYLPWFFPFAAFAVAGAGPPSPSRPACDSPLNVLAKSWSASNEPRRLTVCRRAVFLASLTVLHWGFYQHNLILDTVEYHRYGDAMRTATCLTGTSASSTRPGRSRSSPSPRSRTRASASTTASSRS